MKITIPKSLEALIRRKVEEGHYSTEDEVVADALRVMQARDEVIEIKRARLKYAIDRGYEDVATGRLIQFEIDDQIDFLRRPLTAGARTDYGRARPVLSSSTVICQPDPPRSGRKSVSIVRRCASAACAAAPTHRSFLP